MRIYLKAFAPDRQLLHSIQLKKSALMLQNKYIKQENQKY